MKLLEVKVIPRAKENRVLEQPGGLVVRVTAAANDGKANQAVLRLLSTHLNVPVTRITIVRGATSRHKQIRLG